MNNSLISKKEVLERYGIDKSTLWLWSKAQNFPNSVTPPNCVQLYRESDIFEWEAKNTEINAAKSIT